MADNTLLNTGTGGDNVRTLEDAAGLSWPVGVNCYATTVSDGANVLAIPVAAALTDTLANPTAPLEAAAGMSWNGSTWNRVKGDATNGTLVNLGTNNDVTVTSGTIDLGATDNAVLDSIAASVAGTLTVGSHAVTNAGTFATQATLQAGTAEIGNVKNAGTFVVQIDGDALTALQLLDNAISGTEMQVDVVAALPVGANTIGAVNLKPTTSGGVTLTRLLSAATTNATSVKASAGQLYGYIVSNSNAAARYLKFYDKASAPTVGTDVPVLTLEIPAASTGHVPFDMGIVFATGIAFALTANVSDADTTAVAANEIIVHTLYK